MAKTMYQQKRQFLNKINQRIKTLVNRAGVDKADIESLITINDAWFTETGNLNMTTEAYAKNKERIEAILNKTVPSYLELRENIREELEFQAKSAANAQRHSGVSVSEVPQIKMEDLHIKMKESFNVKARFNAAMESYYEDMGIDWGPNLNRKITSSDLDELERIINFTPEQQDVIFDLRKKLSKLGSLYRQSEAGITNQELFDALQAVEQGNKKIKSWGEKP